MTISDSATKFASWNEWRAQEYLTEYYAEIMADEQHALSFLCESINRLPEVSAALDYGCGPTVHHAAALVPKAQKIYLAEYLADNLTAVRKWLDREPDAHNWKEFTRYILQLEGNPTPSSDVINTREEELRNRIGELYQSDAGDTDPLGSEVRGYFPLVTTHYCAEGATDNKDTWDTYMRNIASLVSPGGTLIVSACGAAGHYMVGERPFPCAGVTAHDVLGCLQQNGFLDIDIRVRSVPDHSEQGYSSVIFACATKACI